jgi:hypothetical protein
MASKHLQRRVGGPALCAFRDVSYSTSQFHLPLEEEFSEEGKRRDWGYADENALRAEIFQFLRNLEASREFSRSENLTTHSSSQSSGRAAIVFAS